MSLDTQRGGPISSLRPGMMRFGTRVASDHNHNHNKGGPNFAVAVVTRYQQVSEIGVVPDSHMIEQLRGPVNVK